MHGPSGYCCSDSKLWINHSRLTGSCTQLEPFTTTWTSDLRQNKEMVFVYFKKGFNKDNSPVTISSRIKQTEILCYELSDQEALTLHYVKAHARVFAASKEQLLSVCHWKSSKISQLYLKDVAWADSECFHLDLMLPDPFLFIPKISLLGTQLIPLSTSEEVYKNGGAALDGAGHYITCN